MKTLPKPFLSVPTLLALAVTTATHAQPTPYAVSAAFENRLYLDGPPSGGSAGATFFSGHVAQANDAAAPTDGRLFLVNSAFGQPIASSTLPTSLFCDQVSAYHIWLQQYFPESVYLDSSRAVTDWGVAADPDGDRLPNLLEYGLARDPTVPTPDPVITIQKLNVAGTNHALVVYRRRSDDPGLVFNLSVSRDLTHWDLAETTMSLIGRTQISTIQEEVAYLDSLPFESMPARFYRLSVGYSQAQAPCVSLISLTGGTPVDLTYPSARPQFSIEKVNLLGANYAQITVRRWSSDSNLTYNLSVSTDLIHWQPADSTLRLVGTTRISAIQDELTYVETASFNSAPRRFYRLALTFPSAQDSCAGIASAAPTTLNVAGVSNAMTLIAQGMASSGCIIRIDYFVNGVLVGQVTDSTPLTWTPPGAGNYSLVARALNNFGVAAYSAPVSVTAVSPPLLDALFVASRANFHNNGPLSVSVNANDPDGPPDTFQLLVGGATVGPPQRFVPLIWQPDTGDAGFRTLTVRVADQWGVAAAASTSIYLFRSPPAP